MSLMTGFAILVGEAIIGFYKKVHAINFGVYGATMVGKTTLSHQLRTRGEVPQINQRTVGKHRASRKNKKCRYWWRSNLLERMGKRYERKKS